MSIRGIVNLLICLCVLCSLPPIALTQSVLPEGAGDQFTDSTLFMAQAENQITIIEFEDLECPYCGRAYPIIRSAIANRNLNLVRKDFPLPQHKWARPAAIWARYLEAQSSKTADEYRGDIYASQQKIENVEELNEITKEFFQKHSLSFPENPDPTGQINGSIDADIALGKKIGLVHTPTIVVCSGAHWIQVARIEYLDQALDQFGAKNKSK
jgi:protein-disulfide isomerase